MSEERKGSHKRHNITLEQRERTSVSGVTDVISFDEEAIIAETEMGILVVRGINLHVNRLNLENGELCIDGEIDAIMYEDDNFAKGKRTSFFSKLFK